MSLITVKGGGVFTTKNIKDINDNFTTVSAGGSGGTFADPTITGTVAGGATYTAPTFTTPALGAATATTINKVTITAPTTSATLTLVTGSSLITVGAFAVTLTATGTTGVTLPTTGTLATLAGTEVLANKTLTTPVIGAATGTSVDLSGECKAASYRVGATAGVSAGPFTTISGITVVNGIVTALTGA